MQKYMFTVYKVHGSDYLFLSCIKMVNVKTKGGKKESIWTL